MNRIARLGTAATLLCTGINVALASDARSIALGGAIIANGKGVNVALSNPASMMAMQRRGELAHLRFGASAEFRDPGNTIDTVTDSDNDNLIDDVRDEIDTLSGSQVSCTPFVDSDDTDCLVGTQTLSDLAGRVLDILNTVDGQELEGFAAIDLGMAYTKTRFPFAINLRGSVTGFGVAAIADGDLGYVSEFNTLLDDDSLTLGEVDQASFLTIDEANQTLTVQQPEDILQSEGSAAAVLRTQLGISVATTVLVAGNEVDIGMTPKFSSLTARSVDVSLSEEFLDGTESAADRFDDSENTQGSFTVDLGGSVALKGGPIRVAAVIYNLIEESVSTNDGVEFETTAQFVVGAQYQRGPFSFTGDIALNEAKVDSLKTQKTGVGVEYATRLVALRAGIAHDAARSADATSLTLGLGLGAFDIGGRLTGTEGLEAGVQLSFSFL